MSHTVAGLLERLVQEMLQADHRLVEEAVEEALQGGRCGVMVLRDRFGRVESATASSDVPYGQIHEYLAKP